MSFIEVRLWCNSPEQTPISGHSLPGWYMAVSYGEDGEKSVLSIERMSVPEVLALAVQVKLTQHCRQGSLPRHAIPGAVNIEPWIQQMCRTAIENITRSSEEAARREAENLRVALDLSPVAGIPVSEVVR